MLAVKKRMMIKESIEEDRIAKSKANYNAIFDASERDELLEPDVVLIHQSPVVTTNLPVTEEDEDESTDIEIQYDHEDSSDGDHVGGYGSDEKSEAICCSNEIRGREESSCVDEGEDGEQGGPKKRRKLIPDKSKRYVQWCRAKNNLIKRSSALREMTGCELMTIVVSPRSGKVFMYGSNGFEPILMDNNFHVMVNNAMTAKEDSTKTNSCKCNGVCCSSDKKKENRSFWIAKSAKPKDGSIINKMKRETVVTTILDQVDEMDRLDSDINITDIDSTPEALEHITVLPTPQTTNMKRKVKELTQTQQAPPQVVSNVTKSPRKVKKDPSQQTVKLQRTRVQDNISGVVVSF
jgi:hypothetical protein